MAPNTTASDLAKQKCTACTAQTPAVPPETIQTVLGDLPGWELTAGEITRTFKFANYYETMAFVNAVAWIAHREDHHPDLEVHYNRCRVRFSTHAIGGISENDLICAAKVQALLQTE